MLPRGQLFFERYGAFGVFIGHFFGPVRAVIPVVAGMCAMRQIPFQIANVSSAFLWSAGVLAPGAFGMKMMGL
jgi:membrane protein DedA with SNARE-associated domain